jgi:hypothetical protein
MPRKQEQKEPAEIHEMITENLPSLTLRRERVLWPREGASKGAHTQPAVRCARAHARTNANALMSSSFK